MDINSLYESRLIALPQKEQGLAWLIEHGPLVSNPPLPMAVLRSLVTDKRILRLRKGLYLIPTPQGRLPSLPGAINLVDPVGCISGHGALMLHGLNDQDISHWYTVTARRQADIAYGAFRVHFVLSPQAATTADRTTLDVRGEHVQVATIAQAIVDEVRFMPYGLDYGETARVLRNAFEVGKVTERDLVAVMRRRPSIAAARRLGFLLELVRPRPNSDLLTMARSQEGVTRLVGDSVPNSTWRLFLPSPADSILRASR